MKIRKTLAILASTLLATLGGMHFAHALEVNQATVQELDGVKGLGQKRAQAIVDERTKNGPFKSAQDLADRIKGIGDKSVQTLIKSGLTINGSSAAPVTESKSAHKKNAGSASSNSATTIAPSNTHAGASATAASSNAHANGKPKSIIIPPSVGAAKASEVKAAPAISLPGGHASATSSNHKAASGTAGASGTKPNPALVHNASNKMAASAKQGSLDPILMPTKP